jgi:hypothetical protein
MSFRLPTRAHLSSVSLLSMQTAGFRQKLSRLIGWFFGTLWATIAVSGLPHAYQGAGYAVAVVLALFFLVRLWRAKYSGESRPLFQTRAYLVSVVAEVVAIYAASSLLTRHGAQQQVLPAVGVIVGLHFIGLWLATRSRRFLSITAGMCLVSLVSMVLPFGLHGVGLRFLVLGAGNALVLWWNASGND